jgi:hypothetical protein
MREWHVFSGSPPHGPANLHIVGAQLTGNMLCVCEADPHRVEVPPERHEVWVTMLQIANYEPNVCNLRRNMQHSLKASSGCAWRVMRDKWDNRAVCFTSE